MIRLNSKRFFPYFLIFTTILIFHNIPALAIAVPSNIVITVGGNRSYQDGQLIVSWDAVVGAGSYSVKITNKDDPTKVTIQNLIGNSNTQATFSKLIGGTKYIVQVRSFDDSLNASA